MNRQFTCDDVRGAGDRVVDEIQDGSGTLLD